MASRRVTIALFAAVGLLLYLWPAIQAPAVKWSDSRIDLDWARHGIGIFSTVPPAEQLAAGVHQAKPLYLLFLRCALVIAPVGLEVRTVVILQSLVLCLAILWVSFGRQQRGAAVYALLLLLCLRLRDSTSSVMSESLTAALLLVVAGGILAAPETWSRAGALGATVGALFWVRPNAGAIALLLVAARYLLKGPLAGGLRAAIAFLVIVVPIAIATRPAPGGPTLRGLAFPLLVGSTDYCWAPAVPAAHATGLATQQGEQMDKALQNWRSLWGSLRRGDPDAGRQIAWRAFHGLFGTEFYDARWSATYLTLSTGSRILTPFLLLASIAIFLTRPFQGEERSLNVVALLLVGLLVGQNLAIGSLPRYDLPFLPVCLCRASSRRPSAGPEKKSPRHRSLPDLDGSRRAMSLCPRLGVGTGRVGRRDSATGHPERGSAGSGTRHPAPADRLGLPAVGGAARGVRPGWAAALFQRGE